MQLRPINHSDCEKFLIEKFAKLGTEITVSTVVPCAPSSYEVVGWECPHGLVFWPQPSPGQMAQWFKDEVP